MIQEAGAAGVINKKALIKGLISENNVAKKQNMYIVQIVHRHTAEARSRYCLR